MQANSQNLAPAATKKIASELRKLLSDPPGGIRLILNEKDLCDVQADIEGPTGTPYEGGVFRCKLVIGSEFPSAPPRGLFLTKIFHPNVATSGDICVNTLKKDWSPELGLTHVLQVIRCLLIVPFPESALNEEASRLFLESYDEYSRRAALYTSIHAGAKMRKAEDDGVFSASVSQSSNDEENSAGRAAKPAPSSSVGILQKASTTSISSGGTTTPSLEALTSEDADTASLAKQVKAMPQKKTSRSALKRL